MQIKLKRIDKDFNIEATNSEGNTVLMDGSKEIGGHGKGMRPMQLLLTALGGCSSVDIIVILRKQKQELESIEIEVNGDRDPVVVPRRQHAGARADPQLRGVVAQAVLNGTEPAHRKERHTHPGAVRATQGRRGAHEGSLGGDVPAFGGIHH